MDDITKWIREVNKATPPKYSYHRRIWRDNQVRAIRVKFCGNDRNFERILMSAKERFGSRLIRVLDQRGTYMYSGVLVYLKHLK